MSDGSFFHLCRSSEIVKKKKKMHKIDLVYLIAVFQTNIFTFNLKRKGTSYHNIALYNISC